MWGILILLPMILNSKLIVLKETPELILLQFKPDKFSLSDHNEFTSINYDNFQSSGESGAPSLPKKSIDIAVPPNGNIALKIISKQTKKITLQKPLVPIPQMVKNGKTADEIYRINPDLYKHKNAFVSILPKTNFRQYNIVPLEICPFSYDFSAGELTALEEITFQIEINGNTSFKSYVFDGFEDIYQNLILNYKTAKFWQNRQLRKITHFDFSNSDFWYKIRIPSGGVYQLSYEQLRQLPVFCEPASLRLFTAFRLKKEGKYSSFTTLEIPLQIISKSEDKFQKNDVVRFKFEIPENIISRGKYVCWLTFGGDFSGNPLRTDKLSIHHAQNISSFERYYPPEILGKTRGLNTIIIYPSEFEEFADSLNSLHQRAFGTIGEIVNQQDIFDLFGETSEGVRDYLETRYNENPELEYVVLMGSGTDNWELAIPKNKIITFDSSDDNFVDFNSDNRPELSIGRLPAQNASEMEIIWQRLKNYVEEPNLGLWRNDVLIMADDENKSDHLEGLSDSDGLNHTYLAQEAEDALSPAIYTEKVLGLEYNFDEYHNKPGAREAMLEKINQGVLIWYFIGHGNEDVLGDEEYFRGSLHMNLLENADKLPLFLAASCEVGMFDSPEIDCIAERLLYNESGGSIGSIASTRVCGGAANTTLLKYFLIKTMNNRQNIGKSLVEAKINSGATLINSKKFNLMGDPLLFVVPPLPNNSLSGLPDSLRAKETISVRGSYDNSALNGTAEFKVFGSKYEVYYTHTLGDQTYSVYYKKNRHLFFDGKINVNGGNYETSFIVPTDIDSGNMGKILCYLSQPDSKEDFTNFYYPIKLSDDAVSAENPDTPSIRLWLDSKKFVSGDYVSTEPELIAAISDSNGINISGSAGHSILLILDNAVEPINVTDYFIYNLDSHTSGELRYQMNNISTGKHSLQLIVFDNYNVPGIAGAEFIAKESGKVAIERLLPYPNPMEKDGYFTFIITEAADITVSVYTLSGRKIKTIAAPNCTAGYNQIYWNGKDDDGDEIANNTYFYKIKAKQTNNGKISEKIGKVIIFK